MKRKAIVVWLGLLVALAVVSVVVGARLQSRAASSTDHAADPAHGDTATTHDMQNMFPAVQEVYDDVTAKGVKVEFTVKSEDFFNGPTSVASGGLATVKLRLGDASSGEARTNLTPRAWIDTASGKSCDGRVTSWVRGQLTDRPLVDLDGSFVLTLDDAGVVSVIDPLVNLAGLTQLYGQVALPAPGGDWALAPAGDRLYVSLPSRGQIAVVNTVAFRVDATIDVGGAPGRLVLSPDGRQLWALDRTEAAVVDTAGAAVSGRVALDPSVPPVFAPDGKVAYVVERDGALAAVDTATRKAGRPADLGARVTALAVAPPDGRVYAGLADGSVQVLAGPDLARQARITTGDTVGALRVSPDGRRAVVTGRARRAYVVDTARPADVRTVTLTVDPGELVVDDRAAYVRGATGGDVDVVALEPGASQAVTTVSYGSPGAGASGRSPRSTMATFASEDALLVADAANTALSFLPRGAAAPSGSFALTGAGAPVAVVALPRGFRQEAPGVYSARFRVPSAGSFDVGVLIDDPRIVHCFRFDATGGADATNSLAVALAPLTSPVLAGASTTLSLQLTDATGAGVGGVADLTVGIGQVAGNWSDRAIAVDRGGGRYEVTVAPPAAGPYRLTFSVPSRQLAAERFTPATLDVTG